jgi:hypothetical protein
MTKETRNRLSNLLARTIKELGRLNVKMQIHDLAMRNGISEGRLKQLELNDITWRTSSLQQDISALEEVLR